MQRIAHGMIPFGKHLESSQEIIQEMLRKNKFTPWISMYDYQQEHGSSANQVQRLDVAFALTPQEHSFETVHCNTMTLEFSYTSFMVLAIVVLWMPNTIVYRLLSTIV